ncbi:hypothetical protein SUGI_0699130 [Cryptomeria japonica]|nr:hypothetical protein SUGI_0699130 [Cryptomeria japonica]
MPLKFMDFNTISFFLGKLSLGLLVLLGVFIFKGSAQSSLLSTNFYANSCPKVEAIVKIVVSLKFNQTFVTVPGTLRLFFHDCFVEGCDASVIIQSTANNTAEKDFPDNLSPAGDGFDTPLLPEMLYDWLEAQRIAWSWGEEMDSYLKHPESVETCPNLISLSAAHTVGFSHCNHFSSRIYSTPIDPTLNPTYASQLQGMCPKNVDPTIAIKMDPTTPNIFDNVYYQNLLNGKGLFTSDEVLSTDGRSKQTVQLYAKNVSAFNQGFINAITDMGRIGVKVGNQGQINTYCIND